MIETTASLPCIQNRLRRILNVLDEVVGGVLRRHARVHKADQVGEAMVAEDHVHPRVALFVAIDVVQPLGAVGVQMIAVVAREVEIERAAQHAFVGRHPLDALLGRQLQRLFGDASLRRPQSLADEPRTASRANPARAGSASAASSGCWKCRVGRFSPGVDSRPTLVSHSSGRMGW